jgi:UDP-glucose 4-epimerase
MNPENRQRALVTGATGVIGPHLVKSLVESGFFVRALCRRHCKPRCLPDGVQIVQGDITDDQTLKAAVTDINVIFHLAAKLHQKNPSSSVYADYRRINVIGTHQLVTAAKAAGVSRMIFFSTINVYGHSDLKKIYTEDSPIKPVSVYAETKAEAEKLVLSEMPCVVLRLAAVYGPRMKGNYRRLLSALKNRYFIMVGDSQNRRTLVYVQDVCQAAILAAGDAAALGQIYNVTDGEIHTFQNIVRVMCSALGRDYPKFKISQSFIRQIFGLVEDSFELIGRKAPIGRFTIDKLIEDIAVSGDRITYELGYNPKFDLEAGWKNCVQSMSG